MVRSSSKANFYSTKVANDLNITNIILQYGMVWALIFLLIVARIVYPAFLDSTNLRNILSQNAPVGIVAVGMTIVMIGGGFDLSVGGIFALGAVVFASKTD